MYNTKVFPTAPASWDVVFKAMDLPDGKPNKDRVQGYVGPIYIADAANYLKAHNPELGITDPYELTQAQFDAAIALLKDQRTIASKYWGDAAAQADDFKTEGFVAAPVLALPGELVGSRQGSYRQHDSTGRDHRLGRHDHAGGGGQASELRLYVARALAGSQSSGRRGGMVWFDPAVPAAAPPAICWEPMGAKPITTTISRRSLSGRRRLPTAATARATV